MRDVFQSVFVSEEPNWMLEFLRPGSKEADVRIPYHRAKTGSAVGMLKRYGKPHVVTTSGYTSVPSVYLHSYELDNALWSAAVTEMCTIIGWKLPEPEAFFQSHVEVQLLAYVLCKHTNLALAPHFRCATMVDRSGKRVNLAAALKLYERLTKQEVVLYLDRLSCRSCVECMTLFAKKTGIDVVVVVDGKRWVYRAPLRVGNISIDPAVLANMEPLPLPPSRKALRPPHTSTNPFRELNMSRKDV